MAEMVRLLSTAGVEVEVEASKAARLAGFGFTSVDGGSSETADKGYDGQKVDALTKLAEDRELTVTGTGKDGKVVKADLVAALNAADEAAANGDDPADAEND